jgi:hypothetical protein
MSLTFDLQESSSSEESEESDTESKGTWPCIV